MNKEGQKKNILMLLAGIVVGVGLGAFLIFGLAGGEIPSTGRGEAGGGAGNSPATGSPAPQFELLDLAGQKVSLADFHGQTVLLNFWATWCGPCAVEMPLFQTTYERHAGELVIVGVNFAEPAGTVQKFVDEYGLTFPILLDSKGAVQKLYQVRGYPSSYLIDSEGVVRYFHIGLMTERQLERYLDDLGVGG